MRMTGGLNQKLQRGAVFLKFRKRT